MKFIIIIFIGLLGTQTLLIGQKAAKKQVITGFVRDEARNSVKGASIFVDGKDTNVLTDSLGRFNLIIPKKAKRIKVVSKHGEVGEYLFGAYTNVIITVTRENLSTDKNYINKAVSKEEKHRRYSSYANIYEMISSEVPGVQVNGNTIILRGTRTFGGSNGMLLVVDGVPVDNISNILAADVKSFRVIKESEAAFYGIRGANGVLIIETLRGTYEK